MMSRPEAGGLFKRSEFVFVGRVLRPATSNVRIVRASEGTAVVRVEEVLHGTAAARDLQGREVTVALQRGEALETGGSYFFFATRLLFGENVAVQEVGRIRLSDETERLRAEIRAMSREAEATPLRTRLGGTAGVVVGTTSALTRAKRRSHKWSEHDPDWWVARVATSSVLKGEIKGEVEVLFANSRDVAWHKAPKFHPGSTGILVLRKERVEDVEGDYFVAVDPLDLLPVGRLAEVRRGLGLKEQSEG